MKENPSLIHVPARNDDARLVEALIAAGANIEAPSPDGWTPLHAAVGFGSRRALAILIQHGANVNVVDARGDSPLLTATALGHFETVNLLLLHGANPWFASVHVSATC